MSLLDVLQVLFCRVVFKFELLMLARHAVTLPCDKGFLMIEMHPF